MTTLVEMRNFTTDLRNLLSCNWPPSYVAPSNELIGCDNLSPMKLFLLVQIRNIIVLIVQIWYIIVLIRTNPAYNCLDVYKFST